MNAIQMLITDQQPQQYLGYSAAPSDGVESLSYWSVAAGLAVMSIAAALSYAFNVGLEWQYVVAGLRTTVQLSLLGYLFVPVFNHPSWWASLLIIAVMGLIAARESIGRAKYAYDGMYVRVWLSIFLPSFTLLVFALLTIIPVDPWYAPQYFVTLSGMVLANALNCISVGVISFLTEMGERRSAIENRLARGATWFEAVSPALTASMRLGLTPTLNNMRVLGLVSIPGMMTGQILGGSPPEQAARYQMIIFFLITAASSMGMLSALLLSSVALFDKEHRLLASARLIKQTGGKRDDIVVASVKGVWGGCKSVHKWVQDKRQSELRECIAAQSGYVSLNGDDTNGETGLQAKKGSALV